MGNNIFSVQRHPAPGTKARIRENKFTRENEIPADILRKGMEVQVLKSANLYKSRKNAPDIAVSTVQFKNGVREAYFTTNLEMGQDPIH